MPRVYFHAHLPCNQLRRINHPNSNSRRDRVNYSSTSVTPRAKRIDSHTHIRCHQPPCPLKLRSYLALAACRILVLSRCSSCSSTSNARFSRVSVRCCSLPR
ncbi:unnamed protein product, partial [Ectocarpus sp. 8 AP-2014]